MSDKWTDRDLAIIRGTAQREMAPIRACPNCGESRQDHLWPLGFEVRCDECGQRYKREMAPSRTPAQRERDMRDAETDTVKLNEAGLTLLERRIAEQSAIIAGQRAAIEALREMVEDVAQGHRHLAGRIDRAELRIITEERARIALGIDARDKIRWLASVLHPFMRRVTAKFPSVGKPSIRKQCDAVEFRGPTEEDNRE